ncbi:acetoacetate-CoA ligase [Dothidotthia symphoricarpi CBS 119687]|uniref:Acetoacetate-CoA ligase n=1 Tax=Dothidotthia symphoricarpi CBS 119687 TaxID=1392245 RepID=A0A6A6A396_9PLEO|nr:acetoacetate-CoA ligase [Dothidotthia symphoricarpi CBS 119687]KAF2126492.1 acetoacetate-CoA ligase [Dothidotthia symphoricarpi CBS 119687]
MSNTKESRGHNDHSDIDEINGTSAGSKLLWRHASPKSTPMYKFLRNVNETHGLDLATYAELHKWSVDNTDQFWRRVWEFVGVRARGEAPVAVDPTAPMFPRPSFFQGASLNFAENLLFPTQEVDEDSIAIVAATETSRETVTWSELRERVKDCQAGMMAIGVKAGDRIAGYVANHTNAVVAMLAATSLGGIWTAVSPDTGVHAVLERLRQIDPVLLLADNASFYNGRSHPVLPKVAEIASGLPTLQAVVVFPTIPSVQVDASSIHDKAYDYATFKSLKRTTELTFTYLSPDHPVYILYSSGTTGAPKCIVHGAIGTLLQHKKEHVLHCSVTPSSRFFYFTTCTWMMWHWLVSGLASGATLVLYDGSPFRYIDPSDPSTSVADDLAMHRLIDEFDITHFGTSAKYLSILEQKSVDPTSAGLTFKHLEAIYSTGSPLAPSTFSYVYSAFPSTINLGSITGGTDIISLFGAPNPLLPVYEGEIQGPGLGMAIAAHDYTGADISSTGEAGDLVCTQPFICQPVAFWGTDGHKKYHGSYFDKFVNENGHAIWHHGDFVRFNPKTGGLWMLGRSDGILKPAGVRFGSAEIYNVLLEHFGEEVSDALCIGRRRETDTDETVVLFVKMAEGHALTEDLVGRIKVTIKQALSARHVPAVVDECPEIPVTTNGKKIEGAVKQILCGMNVKTSASVANAECLDWYREWASKH